MEQPTITVDGQTYKMPRPKCGAWRKLLEFNKNHGNIFTEDAIEKRCEFIAEMYGGDLTADKLLDELYLDEIVPAFQAVISYLVSTTRPKLEAAEKNASEGDATT